MLIKLSRRQKSQVLCLLFLCSMSSQLVGQIEIIDDLGNVVTLSKPAERIVSLAPHITETLFDVGVGNKIVATVQYSDFPEQARSIPVIGSHQEIAYESLLTYRPDLVIAWASGNGDDTVNRIKALGLNVYLDEPREIDDIAASLENFGRLAGSEDLAFKKAAAFRSQLDFLRANVTEQNSLSVFYQVWSDPITTLNGRHLVSDVIRLCGGRNIFSSAIPIAPVINVESVLNANPQIIIASGFGEERPDWLDEWLVWPGLRAAENQQLHSIPPDFLQRNSTRIIQGAQAMCGIIENARQLYN